jgi:hypothetical protein
MGIEQRLARLERANGDGNEGATRVRVVRGMPSGLSRDEEEAWIEAHPECVSKIVGVPPDGGPVTYIIPDNGRGC